MDTTKEELKRYIGAQPTSATTSSTGLKRLGGVVVDMSRSGITDDMLGFYRDRLAKTENRTFIETLLSGGVVNITEHRPSMQACVRHAIATNSEAHIDNDVAGLKRAKQLAEQAAEGQLVGATGKPITSIIHVGIGGSYLGPALLSDYFSLTNTEHIPVHYVSSLDGVSMHKVLETCDVEETLCFVVSKSFSTWETLENGESVKSWFEDALGKSGLAKQLFAVSAELEKAKEWGVSEENVLTFPDGLGGRFSLWSAVSVSVVLQFGWEAFLSFVAGGAIVDEHVKSLEVNSPLLSMLAFQGVNVHVHDYKAVSVSAYNSMLRKVTPWMQQLEMESNGKVWRKDGTIKYESVAPLVFGQHGTDCQHAYFQMLHQGSEVVPVELIGVVDANFPEETKYQIANIVAQARTFSDGAGKSGELESYRVLEGGRPCAIVLLDNPSVKTLGTLLAMYEYRTILHGHLAGVNSFDQFGVEHGKTHVQPVLDELNGKPAPQEEILTVLRRVQS